MSTADKFQCIEKVVKVQPKVFVLGKSEGSSIISPNWTSLILSKKGRDELMGSTAKAAKNFLMGGGIATALGVILLIVASIMAPPKPVTPVDTADVAATADDATPTDEAAAGDICETAMHCCEIISGEGAAPCATLEGAPEASCTNALKGFKKAVKAAHPDRLAECGD